MNMNIKRGFRYIRTLPELKAVADEFEKATAVAVDLEADSMYHYKEKVCLIQMATPDESVVIDPLEIGDLSPLTSVFERSDIKKIFHGADYDIRSLYRDFRIEVNPLFDTQVACRFLGFRETGLEAVIKERFGVELDKRFQKKDWSVRPLPEEMVEYAANDVIYLIPLAQGLENELVRKHRLAWVNEECGYLSQARAANTDDQPLFVRFKGAGKLDRRALAVLEALLQYRDKVAARKDKPLFKIMSNDSLFKIAVFQPVEPDQLHRLNVLSRVQMNMYGEDLIEIVNRSLKLALNKLPVYPRKKAPIRDPQVAFRMNALKRYRDLMAKRLDIDPAIVCTKAQMGAISNMNPEDRRKLEELNELKRWQLEAFGSDMISVLKHAENTCADSGEDFMQCCI